MRKMIPLPLLASLLLIPTLAATARTWTDTTGKKIEADIVAVEGDKVVLKVKGKDVKLPLARLSEEDRKFVEEWQKAPPADATATTSAPGEIKLCGTTLTPGGGATTIMSPLPPEVLKAYSKARTKPTQAKINIALPAGFDPAKPQFVLWVCCPVNNETDRKNGNTGGMGEYVENAIKAGWVVIAADTDLGHPFFHPDDRSEGGDFAFHKHIAALLVKDWPASKTWKFAAGGFSGGAKLAFSRAAQLLECDLDVTGLFLAGCNEDRTSQARDETGVRKSALKKVRVFMSNGKQDDVATPEKAEAIKKSIEGNGYGEVVLDSFEGPHTIGQASYAKALEWFKQPPAPKK